MILSRQSSALLCALLAAASASAQEAHESAHAVLLEWVRTEKLMADEAAAWREDKLVLEGMIDVLRRESAQIDDKMATVEKSIEDSTARIQKLADRETQLRTEIEALADSIATWEKQAEAVAQTWPQPLRDELQLPADTSSADDILKRIPQWLTAFEQADDFNRRVTLNSSLATLPDGKSWEVREIYFGLGGGFWMTGDAQRGGLLQPGAQGWTRQEDNQLTALTYDMIAIAEQRRPSQYLEAPVTAD